MSKLIDSVLVLENCTSYSCNFVLGLNDSRCLTGGCFAATRPPAVVSISVIFNDCCDIQQRIAIRKVAETILVHIAVLIFAVLFNASSQPQVSSDDSSGDYSKSRQPHPAVSGPASGQSHPESKFRASVIIVLSIAR